MQSSLLSEVVQLSTSDARKILETLTRSGATSRREAFREMLEFAIWEATRDRPQKILIEIVY